MTENIARYVKEKCDQKKWRHKQHNNMSDNPKWFIEMNNK